MLLIDTLEAESTPNIGRLPITTLHRTAGSSAGYAPRLLTTGERLPLDLVELDSGAAPLPLRALLGKASGTTVSSERNLHNRLRFVDSTDSPSFARTPLA